MMSKEKQIEEMAKNCHFYDDGVCYLCEELLVSCDRKCDLSILVENLYTAGYRKQSENVIELPCKVGDDVYLPWEWKDTSGIAILTVERISITEAGCSIRTDLWSDDEDYWLAYNCGVFYFEEIGKTVFLVKEEAEKAVAKMKGGAE